MKRALAERAKHSSFEKTVIETPSSSSPPHKVHRIDQSAPSNEGPSLTKEETPLAKEEHPPAIDETSAFYLKHQNRALATELQTLRYAVASLEKERDARRAQCRAAVRVLLSLQNGGASCIGTSASTCEPPSTGSGDSVEWTVALENTVEGLCNQIRSANGNSLRLEEQQQQKIDSTMAKDASVLRAEVLELQHQIAELVASRTDLHQRERRVRRNVYRMSAGLLSPEQVVNALDKDDEMEAAVRLEKAEQIIISGNHNNSRDRRLKDETTTLSDTAIVEELETKIATLEATILRSEESIQKLNAMVTEKDQRISDLAKHQLSPQDEQNLEELERTRVNLQTAQSMATALRQKLDRRESEWAQALGNQAAVSDSVDELIQKFNKRWIELTGSEEIADVDSKLVPMVDEDRLEFALTRKNADLQHRLEQALENVRQADSTRETLKSAIALNASLQIKLDEVKGKYAAVQATRGSNATKKPPGNTKDGADVKAEAKTGTVASSIGGHAKSTNQQQHTKESLSSEGRSNGELMSENNNYDKLYVAYKKLKREYETTKISKETAKAKLERAEKERESLLDNNIKLVKQITEKEDMNAQSLSTILHLKSMTEKLKQERDLLEQEAKAASQLAVSARLTTNAKVKVSEELKQEKAALVERIQELDAICSQLRTDLEAMSSRCAESIGKLAVKDIELGKVVQRSEELANELAMKREEIRQLNSKFEESEQEVQRVKERLAGTDATPALNGQTGDFVKFSVEQLQTQVHFLKNRLACPVCHYRDKECIIMRCRHMHCKQCVEERVSNRSRKCPTCNLKFSENEVQDVWLN